MEKKEISYSPEFKEALTKCNKEDLYLGEGNPNAKILIIGQECALNTERLKEKGWIKPDQRLPLTWQEKEELVMKCNLSAWDSVLANNIQIEQIEEKKMS